MKLRRTSLMFAAACAPYVASAADAPKDYPNRPIRMIVPIGPGSANDTLGRIMAQKIGQLLGQQIVVDNRPGAGGKAVRFARACATVTFFALGAG